jgi:alkaline phosphatase D
MINNDLVGRIYSLRIPLRLIFAAIGLSAFNYVRADEPLSIRVLTYNTHHAEGSDHRIDLDRIAEILRNSRADIVALQEIDKNVDRSNGIDQSAELAKQLGMNLFFGGNIEYQGGSYGNAILSRWPIVNAVNHLCPRFDDGEQRGIIAADIRLPTGQTLCFFATHFDHRSAERERNACARFVNLLQGRRATHRDSHGFLPISILAGDLNAVPESPTLSILNNRWNTSLTATPTIPASKPTRQIDYVLASKDSSLELISTEVLDEAIASDHRPVLSIFRQNEVTANSEDKSAPISRIVFGSCIKQDLEMPIFETMAREQPEVAIFLGDNIYADTSDIAVMRAKYAMLAENASFHNFRAACECIATWDDHDYGLNDIGSEYPLKDESQRAFLDFWNEPANSIRWRRPGVYQSYYFGPPGKQIQIILLDTRYFRSEFSRGKKRVGGEYILDQDVGKTMLGTDQWNWLESELKKHAEIRIIATSLQCVASDAGQETWANLPHERNRLFKTIGETDADGVLFISGDRHWAELSAIREGVPYPFYEMTSSSFNQVHARGTPTENSNRADDQTFHRENYGMILVDWNQPSPTLRLQVRDIDGKVQIDKPIRLDEIRKPAK